MMRYLMIFLFLMNCSSKNVVSKKELQNFYFHDDLSFDEFRIKLADYAKNKPYPNIDN